MEILFLDVEALRFCEGDVSPRGLETTTKDEHGTGRYTLICICDLFRGKETNSLLFTIYFRLASKLTL